MDDTEFVKVEDEFRLDLYEVQRYFSRKESRTGISSNGIVLNKLDKNDQRNVVLVDQSFGTGKTISVINALTELKYKAARVSFYEEPVDTDRVFKIFQSVKKEYFESYQSSRILGHIMYFLMMLKQVRVQLVLLLYIIATTGTIFLVLSNVLEKLHTEVLDPYVFSIFEKYIVRIEKGSTGLDFGMFGTNFNTILLIAVFLFAVNFIPEIIKIIHRSSTTYSDFYLSLTTEMMVKRNIVLMIEDIDRIEDEDVVAEILAILSNYNFNLNIRDNSYCHIILSAEESILKKKLDRHNENSEDSSVYDSFKEKNVYRVCSVNKNIAKKYQDELNRIIKAFNDNSDTNQRISEIKDEKLDIVSLRTVRQKYEDNIAVLQNKKMID